MPSAIAISSICTVEFAAHCNARQRRNCVRTLIGTPVASLSSMTLISLVVTLVVVGLVLYLIETYVPLSPPIKTVLRVVVVLVLCLWILQAFGIVGPTLQVR